MHYILDSYAWIEYFIGSKKGETVRELILDEKNQFFTVDCCLAEIMGWALVNNKEFDVLFKVIRTTSIIVPAMEHDWIEAGKEKFEQRKAHRDFGLIGAMILTKQKKFSCKIISGDKHFKDIKNVVYLE
jgi:hypothetical protein